MRRAHIGTHFSRLLVILTLFLFPIAAQAAELPQSINFTLDETLNTLSQISNSRSRAQFRWDPFLQTGIFYLANHQAAFYAGSGPGENGFLLFDGTELDTQSLPYPGKEGLYFPESFTISLKSAFTRAIEEDMSRYRIAAVIIDPGHGGKDPGALSREDFLINGKKQKAIEKDIVLEVSKRLKTVLERSYPGIRILMTRDRDIYPSLVERTAQANSVPLKDNEAIIYISIHANASLNSKARGYEVWYLDPNFRRDVLDPKQADPAGINHILNDMLQEEYTQESVQIARFILKAFGDTLGKGVPSRGIKAGGWEVVRSSRMPAVLVELGFVSNKNDVQLMTEEDGLRKLTEALYKGIGEFIDAFERSGGFTAAQ